ncbi:MAG: anti-sigma factor family protein, partial [Stellaceae bacterium]
MSTRNDEALVAYLDGELDAEQRRDVESWLGDDDGARARMMALAASATLVRSAFAEVLSEPVPERLLAAARGKSEDAADPGPQTEEVIALDRPARRAAPQFRRWVGYAAAAGLFGLAIGAGGGYFGGTALNEAATPTRSEVTASATNDWLNNAAGYYKLVVSAGDNVLVDVP